MRLVACRYAVVQFAPYRETGEFANAGVVLMCPETGYFGFKLQTRRTRRITDFFDELPREFYVRAIKAMGNELERVAHVVVDAPSHGRADYLRQVFESLIHPREAMVRFSAPRVVMTADPVGELARQFDHQVDRAFATPEYVEHAMEKHIKSLLSKLQLAMPFGPRRVGDDAFHARFPLVQQQDGVLIKIIKPFHLNQAEPVGIYEHGDAWLQKIKRLRDRKQLPDAVLFAIKAPPSTDIKRHAAYTEIRSDLLKLDVQTVDEGAEQQIADFALG
jgi:hypothetical protein